MTFELDVNLSSARQIVLPGAPVLSLLLTRLPPPDGLSEQGWYVFAIALWMAIWWMTEAVPLAVTALLPVLLFPLIDTFDLSEVSRHYADPLVFLFLGGFIMAKALSVWDLDRQFAGRVLERAGSSPGTIIAAVMGVSAFLSMWISNTAAAMIMLPVSLSIASTVNAQSPDSSSEFSPALLLGVAYGATIGGIGTLIGTPPNAIFAAFLEQRFDKSVGFLDWMMVGVPLLVLLLPIAWLILTRLVFDIGPHLADQTIRILRQELQSESRLDRPQKTTLGILVTVVALWLARPAINALFPAIPITDTGIALAGAIILFVIPCRVSGRRFLLNWSDVVGIRWDVLILLGGGPSLAYGISDTDLAQWGGAELERLAAAPLFIFLLCMGLVVVLAGELASNTAMAAILLPIVSTIAVNTGTPPEVLLWPVALFATLGFMLPVATPPNAIVFGSHSLKIRHMIRAGVIVDLVGILLVTSLILLLGDTLLITPGQNR